MDVEERRVENKRRAALDEILEERTYQTQRWGVDETDKTPADWLAIIVVSLGKAAQELPIYGRKGYIKERFKKRLIQIAAICMAAIEQL